MWQAQHSRLFAFFRWFQGFPAPQGPTRPEYSKQKIRPNSGPPHCAVGIIVDRAGGVNSTAMLCYTLRILDAGKRGRNAG
jgi:hypothetical protein